MNVTKGVCRKHYRHMLFMGLLYKKKRERMRQGNVRIIVIHPFVFGLIIFFLCLSKVMDGMYNIVHNPEIFILEKV